MFPCDYFRQKERVRVQLYVPKKQISRPHAAGCQREEYSCTAAQLASQERTSLPTPSHLSGPGKVRNEIF